MIKKIIMVLIIIILLIILYFTVDALAANPPTVTTSSASNIQTTQAQLNGILVTPGCCDPQILIRQNVTKLCNINVSCTITFPAQTLIGDTIILTCQFNGGCVTPTDDGGNNWATFSQNSMNGASDGPIIFAINGTSINPITSITLSQGPATNQGSLIAFEVTPSSPLHVTMTQIGPPTNFGVSANYTRDLIIGTVMLNWDANCPNNVVFEGVKINGFSNGANTECMYGMQNNTNGTHVSLTATNGIRDGNVITLLSTKSVSTTFGFLYGTDVNLIGPTNVTVSSSTIPTTFLYLASGLSPQTTYYFRAWANGSGYVNGTILSFVTPSAVALQFGNYGWVFGFIIMCGLGLWGAFWIKKRREEHG